MLAVMLATALVPLALVSWRLIVINRDVLLANQNARQLQAAQTRAREIEMFVNSYADRAAGYARALELVGPAGLDELNSARLTEVLGRDQNVLAVAVARDGGSIESAQRAERLASPDLTSIVAEAVAGTKRDGRFFVLSRGIERDGAPTAVIAETILRDGRSIGTVVSIVDLSAALRFATLASEGSVAKILSGEDTLFFVVADNGDAVAYPDEHVMRTHATLRGTGLVDEWLLGAPTVHDVTAQYTQMLDGREVHLLGAVAQAGMPDQQRLGVAAVVNRDVVFGSVSRMRNQALWALIVAGFIALLVTVLFAGQIANPIRELARGARAIADGNFAHRIKLVSLNETGQLADDFNLMAEKLEHYVEKLREAAETNRALFIGTVRGLAAAIDGKDPYTRGHSERVAAYSEAIAIELGLSAEDVEKIRIGGLMHDIGKIAIEDKILRKPAPLTDDEFEIMREHPERGTKIMSEIPQMREYISGMRFHHEMVNGKGYPLGLKGAQIPMMARIVSVADTFDAMTTNRPYQKQMPLDMVFERIKAMVNSRYDPDVVNALIAAYDHGRIKLRMQPRPNRQGSDASSTSASNTDAASPAEPVGSSR